MNSFSMNLLGKIHGEGDMGRVKGARGTRKVNMTIPLPSIVSFFAPSGMRGASFMIRTRSRCRCPPPAPAPQVTTTRGVMEMLLHCPSRNRVRRASPTSTSCMTSCLAPLSAAAGARSDALISIALRGRSVEIFATTRRAQGHATTANLRHLHKPRWEHDNWLNEVHEPCEGILRYACPWNFGKLRTYLKRISHSAVRIIQARLAERVETKWGKLGTGKYVQQQKRCGRNY